MHQFFLSLIADVSPWTFSVPFLIACWVLLAFVSRPQYVVVADSVTDDGYPVYSLRADVAGVGVLRFGRLTCKSVEIAPVTVLHVQTFIGLSSFPAIHLKRAGEFTNEIKSSYVENRHELCFAFKSKSTNPIVLTVHSDWRHFGFWRNLQVK